MNEQSDTAVVHMGSHDHDDSPEIVSNSEIEVSDKMEDDIQEDHKSSDPDKSADILPGDSGRAAPLTVTTSVNSGPTAIGLLCFHILFFVLSVAFAMHILIDRIRYELVISLRTGTSCDQ